MTKTQRRLVGRYALAPDIALSEFTTNAVIDWIQLGLVFGRKTQHQWVQKEAEALLRRKPYVVALDEQPGGASDQFNLRIQEPDIEVVLDLCRKLDEKWELQIPPIVRAIEISVDFTPKEPDEVKRAKLFTVLTRHFMTDREMISNIRDRPRFAFGRGSKDTQSVIYRRPNISDRANEHYLISPERDRAP